MMNCNDRIDCPCRRDEKVFTVSIPIHKILNWYRDWRIRKTHLDIEKIEEFEDIVRDYRQDQ